MTTFWRWAKRLIPLLNLLLLAALLSKAVLGTVENWPLWWFALVTNTLYLFWYFVLRRWDETEYATVTFEVVLPHVAPLDMSEVYEDGKMYHCRYCGKRFVHDSRHSALGFCIECS